MNKFYYVPRHDAATTELKSIKESINKREHLAIVAAEVYSVNPRFDSDWLEFSSENNCNY